ncbi:MAG TPA: nitrile hydratase subunit alpha [Chloroflexota bacterium]|nr:nitrile hydratase subunit alpha [Chloroflexota bacterium]
MARTHDMGGRPDAGPIDRGQHQLDDWELLAEAVSGALGAKGIRRTDESRRVQEDLPPAIYESLKYYERWTAGAEAILIEKGLLTQAEVDARAAAIGERWAGQPDGQNGHGGHDGHDHGPDGAHPGVQADAPPNPYALRIRAIAALLVEKGILTNADIQRQLDYMEARSPADGARIVARAWVDPAYKARLLADPKAACAELGVDASSIPELVVLENTDTQHHLVVCTLCSCYPRPILGRPPDWYKSFNYRSRAVLEPRAVMAEFGFDCPPDVEVRVHDSTADVRYLVLPQRPAGTEHLSEAELTRLVTRDSMIGVSNPLPEPVTAG